VAPDDEGGEAGERLTCEWLDGWHWVYAGRARGGVGVPPSTALSAVGPALAGHDYTGGREEGEGRSSRAAPIDPRPRPLGSASLWRFVGPLIAFEPCFETVRGLPVTVGPPG
jgi:hypothetical protein